MRKIWDVIVVGAGAAGMLAAVQASQFGNQVLLLEKSDRPGRKILASGNGRCNLLNSGPLRYNGDSVFADTVLKSCSCESLSAWFRCFGLSLTEEDDGRIYPASFHSSSVLSVLTHALRLSDVTLMFSEGVSFMEKEKGLFTIRTDSGSTFESRCVILTCGGSAQPKLGGTADGYQLLQRFGHHIVPPEPALVPLLTDRKSISGLSGLRIRCRVSVVKQDHSVHEETGEVLFTDYGVSGICVMQCARYAGTGTVLEMNFLPEVLADPSAFLPELKRRRKLFSAFPSSDLLEGLFHARIGYAIMKQSGIPLRGEKCADLTDSDLERISFSSFHYRLEILGSRGFDYAQVTSGGADCSEFDPCTMESRIVSGLYAAGEVLNVDGDCGGFNLMFAFASGWLAGHDVSSRLKLQGGNRI